MEGLLDVPAKSFCHNNKKEGGEGIPLPDASGWFKGAGRKTIDKKGKMRGGDETHDPANPRVAESEGFQHVLDVGPAKLIEGFGEVKLE